MGNVEEIKNTNTLFRYNRFDIKKWCTLRDTYCQLPFFLFTHTKYFFPFFTLSFLLISFSFSWNVHWVLSLLYMYFAVWLWRVASGGYGKYTTRLKKRRKEKRKTLTNIFNVYILYKIIIREAALIHYFNLK